MRRDYRVVVNGSDRTETAENIQDALTQVLDALPSDVHKATVKISTWGNAVEASQVIVHGTYERTTRGRWKALKNLAA
jgi:hypothetical protein